MCKYCNPENNNKFPETYDEPASTKRETEVVRVLSSLYKTEEGFRELWEKIKEKIKPITLTSSPTPASSVKPIEEYQTELAREINIAAHRLGEIISDMRSVLDRIEL